MRSRHAGSIAGTLLGILVFLGGVALLAFTFWYATVLFGTKPEELFQLESKKDIDLNMTLARFLRVIVQILVLLVMALVGGLIANRGIKLFADSRWHPAPAPKKRREPETEPNA